MTFLVARIEHFTRRTAAILTRALTEKCSSFGNYEAGDFLVAPGLNVRGYRLDYPESPLVESDAEEEVAEPVGGAFIFGYNEGIPLPNLCGGFGSSPSSAAWCACGHWLHPGNACHCGCTNPRLPQSPAASAGRGESSSPGVSAGPTSTAPSGERDWMEDAIYEVLAEHKFRADLGWNPDFDQPGCCTHDAAIGMHESFWRDHVAQLISERLTAAMQNELRRASSADAASTFPQHSKSTK